jgi:hypothetical protein
MLVAFVVLHSFFSFYDNFHKIISDEVYRFIIIIHRLNYKIEMVYNNTTVFFMVPIRARHDSYDVNKKDSALQK